MRTLRLSLVGAVALALLGGPAGVARAQDESDVPVTATHVTGTRLSQVYDDSEAEMIIDEFGLEHHRGWRIDETWAWSDPRLPETRSGVWDVVPHEMVDGGTLAVWLGATRLDGPIGWWSGTQTVLYDEVERRGIGQDVYVGEGAYEGLTAVLECIDSACEGYILEGRFPPLPDLPEPRAR